MSHFTGLINIIKERRKLLQVSQKTLSELSGIGLRTIKEFESGKGNPTLLTVQKLLDVLGMEISFKIKDLTK